MFGGTGGCTTSPGDWRASPPAAYRATRALASPATVGLSYRSCGVRSSPSWEAAIATLMATSESPPRSKKLAFRSIEPTPRHCAQMRCNVASIGELPLVTAWVGSAAPPDGEAAVPFVAGAPSTHFAAALWSTQCRWRSKG